MDFLRSVSADQLEGVNEDQAVIFGGELHDWGQRNVSRHDIACIWVAFFQECQQYRCGQGASENGGPFAYACSAWGHCAVPSTDCNPQAHCNTCKIGSMDMTPGAWGFSDLTNCLVRSATTLPLLTLGASITVVVAADRPARQGINSWTAASRTARALASRSWTTRSTTSAART